MDPFDKSAKLFELLGRKITCHFGKVKYLQKNFKLLNIQKKSVDPYLKTEFIIIIRT